MQVEDRTNKNGTAPALPFPIRDMPEGVTSKRETKGANGSTIVIEECKGFQIITTKKGVMLWPRETSAARILGQVLGHGIDHDDQTKLLGRDAAVEGGGPFAPSSPCNRYWLTDVTVRAGKLLPALRDDEDCDELATFISAIAEETNRAALERIAGERKLRWADMASYISEGSDVVVSGNLPTNMLALWEAEDGEGNNKEASSYGAQVVAIEQEGYFMRYWKVTLARFEQVGESIEARTHVVMIPSWRASKPLSELPVRRITAEEKEALTLRGARWWNAVRRPTYLGFHGNLSVPVSVGYFKKMFERVADGRIMVDGAGFRRFSENHFNYVSQTYRELSSDHKLRQFSNALGPDQFWMTSQTVYGFSMRHRAWGQFDMAGAHEPHFRQDAIKQLVLDEDRKALLLALVEHNQAGFQDIVDGKGGGLIVLLHGEPGTGKTLTAEAVADKLGRPLYMVSVGELGTNPQALETRLTQILELAASWNAVVLLDEADIFMEKRTSGPGAIERNAMVAIFLRTLEYHSGVMFLTTNRDQEFDPAFHSRISITLEYGKMNNATRRQVWINMLGAAGIEGMDVDALVKIAPLNGRNIKNVIRAASILATSQGRAVTMDDFRRVIPLSVTVVGKKTARRTRKTSK